MPEIQNIIHQGETWKTTHWLMLVDIHSFLLKKKEKKGIFADRQGDRYRLKLHWNHCTKRKKRENCYALLMRISIKSIKILFGKQENLANINRRVVNVLTARLSTAVPRLDGPGL